MEEFGNQAVLFDDIFRIIGPLGQAVTICVIIRSNYYKHLRARERNIANLVCESYR